MWRWTKPTKWMMPSEMGYITFNPPYNCFTTDILHIHVLTQLGVVGRFRLDARCRYVLCSVVYKYAVSVSTDWPLFAYLAPCFFSRHCKVGAFVTAARIVHGHRILPHLTRSPKAGACYGNLPHWMCGPADSLTQYHMEVKWIFWYVFFKTILRKNYILSFCFPTSCLAHHDSPSAISVPKRMN